MAAIRDPNSLRRCLYEVLGIEKTAEAADIKQAYRRLALEFHPDKNIHQAEVAAEKFKEVQYAYSILSDDQERAWYDSHRDAILRGADEEDAAVFEGINLWPFLSPQCYSGYTDEANGFYGVYNKLFEDLDNEERAEIATPGEPAPKFGQSTSDYKTVLRFYNYWSNFVSKRSYAYADQYKPSEAPNRKIKKLIEKDNKKERDKARKARMELIKHLVDFIKKRDKRLLEHQQRIKKEEELRLAEEKIKNEQEKQQRKLQKDEYEQQRWEEIEKEIDWSELIDHDEHSKKKKKNTNAETEEQEFFCAVCNKSFKSKKQWENHERSKTHKERLEILKAEVTLDDDIEAELEEQQNAEDEDEQSEEEEQVEAKDETESSEEEEEVPAPKKNQRQNKKQARLNRQAAKQQNKPPKTKQKPVPEVKQESEEEEEEEQEEELQDDYSFVQNMMKLRKQQKKKQKKNLNNRFADLTTNDSEEDSEEEQEAKPAAPAVEEDSEEEEAQEEEESEEEEKEDKPAPAKSQAKPQPQNNNTAKATKPKKKAKKGQKNADPPNYCVTCKTKFDTRNQLFKHLKDTGHAKPV